jgi:predicted ArsR family transcriptional regulator
MRQTEPPPGHVAPANGKHTGTRQRIADILEADPGTQQKVIAIEFGITKQSVSAHVAALSKRGLTVSPDARCLQCREPIPAEQATRRPKGYLHLACAGAWALAQACARAGVS